MKNRNKRMGNREKDKKTMKEEKRNRIMSKHSLKKQLLQYLALRLVQIIVSINKYNDFYYTAKLVSNGVLENMAYAGLIYYEEKGVEDLVTFSAAKDLNALLEVKIHKGCNDIDCFVYNSLSRKKMLVLKEDRMFILLLNLIKAALN